MHDVIPYAEGEGWHNLVPEFQRIVLMKIVKVVLQQLRVPGHRLLAIPTDRALEPLVKGHYGQSGFAVFCSSCYQLKIGASVGSFLYIKTSVI